MSQQLSVSEQMSQPGFGLSLSREDMAVLRDRLSGQADEMEVPELHSRSVATLDQLLAADRASAIPIDGDIESVEAIDGSPYKAAVGVEDDVADFIAEFATREGIGSIDQGPTQGLAELLQALGQLLEERPSLVDPRFPIEGVPTVMTFAEGDFKQFAYTLCEETSLTENESGPADQEAFDRDVAVHAMLHSISEANNAFQVKLVDGPTVDIVVGPMSMRPYVTESAQAHGIEVLETHPDLEAELNDVMPWQIEDTIAKLTMTGTVIEDPDVDDVDDEDVEGDDDEDFEYGYADDDDYYDDDWDDSDDDDDDDV